jgi:uncharacterized protein YcfL
MQSPRLRLTRSILILSLLLLPTVASAQTAHKEPNQQVVFDDDLLDADLSTPFGDPLFAAQLPPARTQLIRPRTNFVAELYRSVEQI